MQNSLTKDINAFDRKEFPFDNKRRFFIFILIFFLLIPCSIFILYVFRGATIAAVFSWGSILFDFYFLCLLVVVLLLYYTEISILKKFLFKKPALIISDEGITDYSTISGVGLIDWNDVVHIGEWGIFITITVIDPKLYISRQGDFLKRTLLSINIDDDDDFGDNYPFFISPQSLGVNQAELFAIPKSRWEIYLANKKIS